MLRCPKPEILLEYVSIPQDVSWTKRTSTKIHIGLCKKCQTSVENLKVKLDSYFTPEPDITSSLLNVYSRLQRDETLILKGWKIGEIGSAPRRQPVVANGWFFRGAVTACLVTIVGLLVFVEQNGDVPGTKVAENGRVPFAQIRFEDRDNVEVRYVEPELLHSVEFETTNVSHTVTR